MTEQGVARATEAVTPAVELAVELGALTELPVGDGGVMWESHDRGKNWLALVRKDPQSPGGLARSFFERAKGDYFYLVPDGLKAPAAVEIGADYYTGGGHARRRRWYGVIESVAPDRLTVRRYDTAARAIAAAEELADQVRRAESLAESFKTLTPKSKAVAQILALMAEHGITLGDLSRTTGDS